MVWWPWLACGLRQTGCAGQWVEQLCQQFFILIAMTLLQLYLALPGLHKQLVWALDSGPAYLSLYVLFICHLWLFYFRPQVHSYKKPCCPSCFCHSFSSTHTHRQTLVSVYPPHALPVNHLLPHYFSDCAVHTYALKRHNLNSSQFYIKTLNHT